MMIATIVLLSALQAKPAAPSLPPGSNSTFQGVARAIGKATKAKDFAKAQRLLAALPTRTVSIYWEDSAVPAARRPELIKARDKAFAIWREAYPELNLSIGPQGRIKVSFKQALPPNADTGGEPAGAVFFLSPNPAQPAVEAVISLTRGASKTSTEAKDVTNEVVYAIGSYLGLDRTAQPGAAMSRSENPYPIMHRVSRFELASARATLKVADQLRTAVQKKQVLSFSEPELSVSPTAVKLEPSMQGSLIDFSLQVTNTGSGTLNYKVEPDCGCFSRVQFDPTLRAGDSALVGLTIDTTNFPGEQHKELFIYSDDPVQPVRRVTVDFFVEPRYSFIEQGFDRVALIDGPDASIGIILLTNPTRPLNIKKAQVQGAPVDMTTEPWSGEVDDPATGKKVSGKGYLFKMKFPRPLAPGRTPMSLMIATDDAKFDRISYPFSVQQGLAALPPNVYFGDLGRIEARAWFMVSRPGRPFKILKVESDHPNITATVEPYKGNSEYKVIVKYDGKADYGSLEAKLKVFTDDPQNSMLEVTARGTVR